MYLEWGAESVLTILNNVYYCFMEIFFQYINKKYPITLFQYRPQQVGAITPTPDEKKPEISPVL